jgi:hypothetical protein
MQQCMLRLGFVNHLHHRKMPFAACRDAVAQLPFCCMLHAKPALFLMCMLFCTCRVPTLLLLCAAGPLGSLRGGAREGSWQRAGAVHGAGQGQQAADLQQVCGSAMKCILISTATVSLFVFVLSRMHVAAC